MRQGGGHWVPWTADCGSTGQAGGGVVDVIGVRGCSRGRVGGVGREIEGVGRVPLGAGAMRNDGGARRRDQEVGGPVEGGEVVGGMEGGAEEAQEESEGDGRGGWGRKGPGAMPNEGRMWPKGSAAPRFYPPRALLPLSFPAHPIPPDRIPCVFSSPRPLVVPVPRNPSAYAQPLPLPRALLAFCRCPSLPPFSPSSTFHGVRFAFTHIPCSMPPPRSQFTITYHPDSLPRPSVYHPFPSLRAVHLPNGHSNGERCTNYMSDSDVKTC
jgi:hypothetical protein